MEPLPMPSPEPPRELAYAALRAIAAYAKRSDEGLDDALATIVDYGSGGLFTACTMYAELATRIAAGGAPPSEGALATFMVTDEDGNVLNIDDLDADEQPIVWASRFAVAVRNRDFEAAYALFKVMDEGSASDDDEVNGLAAQQFYALLRMAADATVHAFFNFGPGADRKPEMN